MARPEDNVETGHAYVITQAKSVWRISRQSLEAEDYSPFHCVGVDELRSAAETAPPAVIIVDADACDRRESDTCAEIRTISGCEYIPLLLLADDDNEESLSDAYGANVTAVLAKPVTKRGLAERLRSLGDTGRTLSGIRALRPADADVLERVPDAFLIVGTDGRFRQYLGGANDDVVLNPEVLEGQLAKDVWPQEAAGKLAAGVRRVMKQRSAYSLTVTLERESVRNDYEVRLLVQGRDRVMMIMRNITYAPAESSIDRNRASDTVTGLTDREAFMQHFESVIADAKLRERGIAVMCIDIDRFTRINETLGRAVGDAVLRVAAKRIVSCLRGYDHIVRIDDKDEVGITRISGDEFVLLLGDIESRSDVAAVAARIRDAFSAPITIEGHQLGIKPSIGIAQSPLDGDNAHDLLKNARVALDEAKVMSADGHEFFSSTMKYRSRKRLDVKNELRWAIDKDQLDIHFLPRIDLQTGHVAGLEALLRWIHPLRGSVPLSEVIPLAEATGLMFAIGEWVLNSTCRQAHRWRDELGDVPCVSVNLSQQEFSRDDLPQLVGRALDGYDLPAEKLELEITEAMLMRSRQADATLAALHALGVGIVVDDFGQGHSSISHLTRLPIKAIKIDRAFVKGVREPGPQQAICSAMIAMSRELGISVIAEGVESELQVEFLRERGCDAVQGFLFTEPLPPDQVPAFIDACADIARETNVVDLTTIQKKIATRSVG